MSLSLLLFRTRPQKRFKFNTFWLRRESIRSSFRLRTRKALTRRRVPISPDKSVRSYKVFGGNEGRASVYRTAISIDRHGRIEARSLPLLWRFFSRLGRPRKIEVEREREREFARFYIYKKKGEKRGSCWRSIFGEQKTGREPPLPSTLDLLSLDCSKA